MNNFEILEALRIMSKGKFVKYDCVAANRIQVIKFCKSPNVLFVNLDLEW
jgi:hypothetical protein